MEYPVLDTKKTGTNIRKLMKQNNIKVRDIVEYMGFESEQSVYKWLRGDSLPKVDNLFALGKLFHTSMDNILIEREGEDKSSPSAFYNYVTTSSLKYILFRLIIRI